MKIKTKALVSKVTTSKPATKVKNLKLTTAKTAAKNVRTTFTVRAEVDSQVFIAGSFNQWNPTAKKMTDKKGTGLYTASIALSAGVYQYKFIIDGTWCADPDCTDWVQNDHGTLNSVIHVK